MTVIFFFVNDSYFEPAAAPGCRPSLPLCRVVHLPAPYRAGLRRRHYDMDGFRRADPRWSLLLSPWPVAAWAAAFACSARCVPAQPKDQGVAPLRACPCASTSLLPPLLCASMPALTPVPLTAPTPLDLTSTCILNLSAGMSIARVPSAAHTIRHTAHTRRHRRHRASTRISLHGGCSR